MRYLLNCNYLGPRPPEHNYGSIRDFICAGARAQLPSLFVSRMLQQLWMTLASAATAETMSTRLTQIGNLLDSCCDTPIGFACLTSIAMLAYACLAKMLEGLMRLRNTEWSNTTVKYLAVLLTVYAANTYLSTDSDWRHCRFPLLCRDVATMGVFFMLRVPDLVLPMLIPENGAEPNLSQFARALIVSGSVWCTSIILVILMLPDLDLNPWMIIFPATFARIILKVFFSWGLYAMCNLQTNQRTFGDGFQKHVYYYSAACNVVQVMLSIYIVIIDVQFFYSRLPEYLTRTCCHAFVDIVMKAYPGYWEMITYIEWYLIISKYPLKIRELPDASKQQLMALDDVCPICVEEMLKAKRTMCGHYFHLECLGESFKWSDKCPYCQQML